MKTKFKKMSFGKLTSYSNFNFQEKPGRSVIIKIIEIFKNTEYSKLPKIYWCNQI